MRVTTEQVEDVLNGRDWDWHHDVLEAICRDWLDMRDEIERLGRRLSVYRQIALMLPGVTGYAELDAEVDERVARLEALDALTTVAASGEDEQ